MIGIIDVDLIGRKKHRFPNLACMKISSYYKQQDEDVQLLLNYNNLSQYDKVYVSKVFTDTPMPKLVGNNIIYGGTGFYYDQAAPLPYEIEHCMPDYHLYDEWLQSSNFKQTEIKYYTNYSIGFLTRGCFRHCEFCVNKKYNASIPHSPFTEFYDPTRKKICLLDDNFLACKDWRPLLEELQALNKPFVFKQGLDARLLTAEKSELLFKSKYDDDFIFAFDDIADYDIIKNKLNIIRQHTNKNMAFKTAAEMREITQESIMSDVESILQKMEACAKQGKNQYAFEGSLTAIQKENLKELGYQIQTGQQYNVPWAIISW